MCFYTKNSQKVNFSSNCDYNTGHFIDFYPKKIVFSSKCDCISSTILTFCRIIQCFYTKNSQKLIFLQIETIIQGTLLTFHPEKVIFSSNAPAYRALFWLFCPIIQCVYTTKIPKKLIFLQIAHIIQGTLLTFFPKKKWFFPQNAPGYRALFWLFCPITQCVLHQKFPKPEKMRLIRLIYLALANIIWKNLLL